MNQILIRIFNYYAGKRREATDRIGYLQHIM